MRIVLFITSYLGHTVSQMRAVRMKDSVHAFCVRAEEDSVRRINLISALLTLTQGGGETIVLNCRSVQDHIPVMERELWHRWYGISICESLNAAGRSLTRRRRPCANKPDLLSSSSQITLTETFIQSILLFISLWSLLEFCALKAGRTAACF